MLHTKFKFFSMLVLRLGSNRRIFKPKSVQYKIKAKASNTRFQLKSAERRNKRVLCFS